MRLRRLGRSNLTIPWGLLLGHEAPGLALGGAALAVLGDDLPGIGRIRFQIGDRSGTGAGTGEVVREDGHRQNRDRHQEQQGGLLQQPLGDEDHEQQNAQEEDQQPEARIPPIAQRRDAVGSVERKTTAHTLDHACRRGRSRALALTSPAYARYPGSFGCARP